MNRVIFSKYWWIPLLSLLIGVNFLASIFHSRFDLTKEKRYTLSQPTKKILKNLDLQISIDVFLKGDFPAGFKKLANSVQEFLDECKDYSNGKLKFQFIDPFKNANDAAEAFVKNTRIETLHDSMQIKRDTSGSFLNKLKIDLLNNGGSEMNKKVIDQYVAYYIDSFRVIHNISPFTLQAPAKAGDEMIEKKVLPGAIIHYGDKSEGVNFIQGQKSYGTSPEQLAELYNDVESMLEYEFASSIQKLTVKEKPIVGYALGNGELFGPNVDDAVKTLVQNYRFDTINLKLVPYIPSEFSALVILKPTKPFTDEDKFKIDQYVMRGGKLFWMIDNMYAELDSLRNANGFIAYDRGLNLEDILFRYGVRINQNLLQDMQADKLPQISNDPNNKQTRLVNWPFFPVLNGTDNPISKNLDGVRAIFPNTLDTVKVADIKKTFLLRSSANARVLQAPAKVDFEFWQIAPEIKQFSVKDTAVAALLEGRFKSLFAGRVSKSLADSMAAYNVAVRTRCESENKMIVVADGDIATNQVSPQYGPLPMGYNFYTNYSFANKTFFTNAMEYLVNPSEILETRSKDYTLRLLDPKKVKEQKVIWQFANTALPTILIIVVAFFYQESRKRKYA